MPLLTKERYIQIVDFLETKVLTILPDMHVFKTPHYFASPQDFAGQVEDNYTSEYKVKYAMFSYGVFVDSKTKGCDDDPNVNVNFRLQLYRSIQQAKTGQDNSHDLLINDLVDLRNGFLTDRVIELHNIEHEGLVQVGDLVRVQQCEHIVNELGNWVNLRVGVEINNG